MPRERETAGPPEVESEETRDLRQDIRRKRDAFVTTASSESSTAGMSTDFLMDDEKVGLAVNISVASIPGAYRAEEQRRLPKPSQEELLKTARLDAKEDSYRPQPDTGPEISPAELCAIDDLQVRMEDFQLCAAIEDLGEKRGQRQRRSLKFWAAIAAFVVIIIGAVVGATLGLLGGNGRNSEEPGSLPAAASAFDVDSCYARSEELSERYDSFRSVVVSFSPDMATAIDTSYSSASVALCWISDFDEFELEISEGKDFELIQRFVLTAVYYHFEGTLRTVIANEFWKKNWLSGLHVCKWDFVECSNTGDEVQNEVTGLSVGSVGLTGRIPIEELAMLKNLSHLGFDQSLTGSIPSELGLLTQLTTLLLAHNKLTGSIPSELGQLTQLMMFAIGNNRLTDSIPSEFFQLAQLTLLRLSYNQLTGSVPSRLGVLTRLTAAGLGKNKFTGSIPSQIGLLTQLTTLELSNNQLTSSIPSQMCLLNQLHSLDLGFSKLTGSIPSQIGLWTQLIRLIISSNQLTGSIPSELGLLTQLTSINLETNKLTGSIPSQMGLLNQLHSLSLSSNNQLVGSIPSSLCSSIGATLYIDCGEIACTCCNTLDPRGCSD